MKRWPFSSELAAQGEVVVDLAVEDHLDAAVLVGHGLVGVRREVDDREATEAEADLAPGRDPQAVPVRAAVDHGVPHPRQDLARDRVRGRGRQPADDSAHSVRPLERRRTPWKGLSIGAGSTGVKRVAARPSRIAISVACNRRAGDAMRWSSRWASCCRSAWPGSIRWSSACRAWGFSAAPRRSFSSPSPRSSPCCASSRAAGRAGPSLSRGRRRGCCWSRPGPSTPESGCATPPGSRSRATSRTTS